jgi:SAM-dependent methyltransferase
MRLWQTKRHWETWARVDPFWAVLTSPEKSGNRWRDEEFFATGRATVEADLACVKEVCPFLGDHRALDFGCGVGRLTQALASHFREVVGIDISKEMVRLAVKLNLHGDRVKFMQNSGADLSLLSSDQFDFVYSLITLQHMDRAYARKYIAEFVRVAAAGGVIFFQMPAIKPPPSRSQPLTLGRRLWHLVNRSFPMKPVMEMHALLREEVVGVLQAAGAEVLKVVPYGAAGDIASFGYLAVKCRPLNESTARPHL